MEYSPATSRELTYDGETLDLAHDFTEILEAGHVIHGYSTGGSVRMLMVLETKDYSDTAPLLAFGTGANTEDALRRMRDSYRRRAADGLESITEKQYPEFLCGLATGGSNTSRLDVAVWGGSVKIYQDTEGVVAWAEYGRHLTPVEGRGQDMAGAVASLEAQI